MVLYSTSLGVTNSGDQKRVWVANISQVEQVPNPLPLSHATGLFLYPFKRPENFWFFNVFKGHRMRPVA